MQTSHAPLEADAVLSINKAADELLATLKKTLGERASYGAMTVKALSEDLDKNRQSYNADDVARRKILWTYGAFLGRAIIENVGKKRAIWIDSNADNFCVKLTTSKREEVIASPFVRVARHLEEGAESSILAFFLGLDETARTGVAVAEPGKPGT